MFLCSLLAINFQTDNNIRQVLTWSCYVLEDFKIPQPWIKPGTSAERFTKFCLNSRYKTSKIKYKVTQKRAQCEKAVFVFPYVHFHNLTKFDGKMDF